MKTLRWHVAVFTVALAISVANTLSSGSTVTYAAVSGGGGGCTPTAWHYKSGQTTANKYGNTIEPVIYIDWTVRYNGCVVESQYMRASYKTVLTTSVSFTWKGFYAGNGYIDVGANWQTCLGPVSNVGACWGDYERQRIYKNGSTSTPWPHIW